MPSFSEASESQIWLASDEYLRTDAKELTQTDEENLKTSTDRHVRDVDSSFAQEKNQRVDTCLENSPTC